MLKNSNNANRPTPRKRKYVMKNQYTRKFVKAQQLEESEVGVTEYISNLDGFSGVIKARSCDFLVNEIDIDGNVAQITDQSIPGLFVKKNNDVAIPEESPIHHIDNTKWKEILELLQLKDNTRVHFDCNEMAKNERGELSKTIKEIFGDKLIINTVKQDDKKYMEFRYSNNESKPQRRISNWPENCPDYVHFQMHKQNLDTEEAILSIAKVLIMPPSCFKYAAAKERRAMTTQWISVDKVLPQHLLYKANRLKNIQIGNLTLKDKPLHGGQLKGNRFGVVIRNLTAPHKSITHALKLFKSQGFINYYGPQYFGNDKKVPTYTIGIKLIQGKWQEACNLILMPKLGDGPNSYLYRAKYFYANTSDAKNACLLLDNNFSVEAMLLEGLAKNNDSAYIALENVPRKMRLMYIHAFQCYIWNKVVSNRIKNYGIKPIIGDLVIDSSESMKCKHDDDAEDEFGESDADLTVKSLKKNDLKNYTIFDVVLPLPGYLVTYPDNSIQDYYKQLLQTYNLTLDLRSESSKDIKTYPTRGSYRKIVSKVDNFNWKFMHYNDPNKPVIQSDVDRLRNNEPLIDRIDGKYKCVTLKFDLNASSDATMAVRELTKMDTSPKIQSKLNNYHTVVSALLQKENNPVIHNGANKQKLKRDSGKKPSSVTKKPIRK